MPRRIRVSLVVLILTVIAAAGWLGLGNRAPEKGSELRICAGPNLDPGGFAWS